MADRDTGGPTGPSRPVEMGHLVVVGSLNLDLIASVDRLPAPGQTVIGSGLQRSPGGKGANQAVAARRLGAKVTLVGAVGDDDAGRMLRAALAADGVVDRVVVRPGQPTGTALIVVDRAGSNTVTVVPGANATVDPGLVEASAALFAGAAGLMLQREIPDATGLAAAQQARAAGALVTVNLAPSGAGPDIDRLVRVADVLVVNEEEARALVPTGSGDRDFARLARDLRRRGPSLVVITLGAQGAVADDGLPYAVPGRTVDAVDTVGAGDAFCAAFAVALAEGRPTADALRFANAAGALATTIRGAQPSLPRRSAVDYSMLSR